VDFFPTNKGSFDLNKYMSELAIRKDRRSRLKTHNST